LNSCNFRTALTISAAFSGSLTSLSCSLTSVHEAFGSTRKAKHRPPRQLRRIRLEPSDGPLPIATQFHRRHIAVAMRHDANHRIRFGRHPHAFRRRRAPHRLERLHGHGQVFQTQHSIANLIAIAGQIDGVDEMKMRRTGRVRGACRAESEDSARVASNIFDPVFVTSWSPSHRGCR